MFNHSFRVFCSLSFNICHSLLTIFNNFGLIFFQIQSKSLLTTNFTTYLLTKFTTISANLSNISIRILLSWSIRMILLITNMRFEEIKMMMLHFQQFTTQKKRLRINSKSIFHTKLHYSLTSSIIFPLLHDLLISFCIFLHEVLDHHISLSFYPNLKFRKFQQP